MKTYKLWLILAVMLTLSQSVKAEIDFNGFGSIVAGKVTQGDRFLADYANTAIYDSDWSLEPESSLGLQATARATENFSIVAQVVANSASEPVIDLDWLYLDYQFSADLSAQVGRKRLPLYYYSDYYDIAYAYYWIRPPADLYTWQITNYNGASLLYERAIADWDAALNIYYGNETSDDNELLGLLFGVPVDEEWNDMTGLVLSASNEWLDLRFSYMRSLASRKINSVPVLHDVVQTFTGVSVNFRADALQILTELNHFERPDNDLEIDTWMLSLAYRIGDLTPHITRSQFEQRVNRAGNDEKHNTTSIGVRWDFYPNVAFKLQYDRVEDEGVVVPVLGDADVIAAGVDFIF